ncbi:hypothetical protein OR1_03485 [Geobacter sp. OR-1]|uniref:hypothetical protein n=1 Tax=Geobacter sp. OR-1 TaxID=1266765 RepID=UPI0005444B17|nr:hypothetical protein [Geobacter sp. OR-1]GAM11175.1 hypothetical protein OR1_03485 [Geobacter sp. OR-1]
MAFDFAYDRNDIVAMNDRYENIQKLLVLIFFAALFYSLTVPVSDPDFWWHLASGKWMWTNGALIQGDPFTIDSNLKEVSLSRDFILKQYWLAQLVFYWGYLLAGFKGIIFLSSFVFTLMFYTTYRLMINGGVSRIFALLLVYISVMVVVGEFNYIGTKPQMWSSLFSVVIVLLLEALKKGRTWPSYAIPGLMLVWANLHGGFVLGDVMILLYCIGSLISRTGSRRFYLVSIVAVLLSGLNPNGYKAVISVPFVATLVSYLNLESLQSIKSVAESINELQSIFQHASIPGIIRGLPYFTTIFVLSLVSFLLNFRNLRRFRAEHYLLYVMVFLMGLSSIRFIIFFTLIASFIATVNLKGFWDSYVTDKIRMPKKAVIALLLATVALTSVKFAAAGIKNSALDSDQLFVSPFEKAADFMLANNLKGNLFNDYNAGGYLIWRVSPGIKVFVDGRGLYGKIFDSYRVIVDNPFEANNYLLGLHYFNIDMVMIPGCDKVSGTLIKLAAALLEDKSWVLIYEDPESLIFIRDIPQNADVIKRLAIPKFRGYRNIYALATISREGHAAKMPNWKLAVAVANEGVGNLDEAARWIDDYLQASPNDDYAKMIKQRIVTKRQKPL